MNFSKIILIGGLVTTLMGVSYAAETTPPNTQNPKLGKPTTAPTSKPTAKPSPTATPKAATASHDLDGQNFKGTLSELGKNIGKEDTLQFANGKFYSTACEKYGMSWAPYTTEKQSDGSFKFKGDASSSKANMGSTHWEGIAKGSSLTATMNWTVKVKKAEKVTKYTFHSDAK